MTMAVRFRSGLVKFGAFVPCPGCSGTSRDEDDLARTDHPFDLPTLEPVGASVRDGQPPHLDPATHAQLVEPIRSGKMVAQLQGLSGGDRDTVGFRADYNLNREHHPQNRAGGRTCAAGRTRPLPGLLRAVRRRRGGRFAVGFPHHAARLEANEWRKACPDEADGRHRLPHRPRSTSRRFSSTPMRHASASIVRAGTSDVTPTQGRCCPLFAPQPGNGNEKGFPGRTREA